MLDHIGCEDVDSGRSKFFIAGHSTCCCLAHNTNLAITLDFALLAA